MIKRVLFIVAHPDDEVIGCGGLIAKLISEGCTVSVLILSNGVSSRYLSEHNEAIQFEVSSRLNSALNVKKILGYQNIDFEVFPDNKFDSIPLLDIVRRIESSITKYKPELVVTHFDGDLNIDHKITSQATRTATRPLSAQKVKELWEFETASSTEWTFNGDFRPNLWIDIENVINLKIMALN